MQNWMKKSEFAESLNWGTDWPSNTPRQHYAKFNDWFHIGSTTLVPLALPHRAMQDTKLFGYDIPSWALILANIWTVHHDPSIWPIPRVFDPQNFYEHSGDQIKLKNNEYLIPFSLGIWCWKFHPIRVLFGFIKVLKNLLRLLKINYSHCKYII